MVAPKPKLTPAEYLVWERQQPTKHEFFRGEVFAMAGASPRHNALCANASRLLYEQLRARGCHVFTSDQRISLEGGERYVYPDISIVCGKPAVELDDVIVNPTMIIEVLSRSTEQNDRGSKWQSYQQLASLTDYVLVAQWAPHIEQFTRDARGWAYRSAGRGETITFANGVELHVDTLFEGMSDLPGDDPPQPT